MNASIRTLSLWSMLGLLLLTQNACEDTKAFPCVNGDGPRITEARTVANFDKIVLDLPGDLYLTRDSAFSLTITAQENVLETINTDVSGDILEIRNDRCLRNFKTVRIDLSLPALSMLEVKGSGDIYGQDEFDPAKLDLYVKGSGSIEFIAKTEMAFLEIDGSGNITLDADASEITSDILGSGDITLSGLVETHVINIKGTGEVRGFDLLSQACGITLTGSGDCEVAVDSLLDVIIKGTGDVYYKGNPALNVEITGNGEVVNAN